MIFAAVMKNIHTPLSKVVEYEVLAVADLMW